jgi:methyltransferase (TIGR00027 family)
VKLLSWIVYIPLQLLAVPLAIVGMIVVGYYQLRVSKRLGVSQTAIEVFNGRWTLHIFGMRDDPGAAKLGAVLPNTSTFGLWLALFPLWVKAKIAGQPAIYPRHVELGHETVVELIPGRTVYFDRVIARQLPQVQQFVLMGAGVDTRPYGALNLGSVKVFELDQAATQQLKRDTLAAAGIDASHVTFVTVDFSTEDLFEKLAASGYDPSKRTLFLWEGVTLYLSEEAVRDTMAKVHANAAPGSVLLADIYGERLVSMMRSRAGQKMLEYTNEAGNFALRFDTDWEFELRTFVESTSLTLGESFFMGTASGKGPFMVVAEMVV